jgi:hypothetical protein
VARCLNLTAVPRAIAPDWNSAEWAREMKAQRMSGRIMLIDLDRPEEPFEVDVEEYSQLALRLRVPHTIVSFEMRRNSSGAPFEGAIGGRNFIFDPATIAKKKTRKRNS